jgi:hypothetical protein
MDIQQLLDDWLASHPEYQRYILALYYQPPGAPTPEDATHTLTVASVRSDARDFTIAVALAPQYAAMAEALLALLATSPPPEPTDPTFHAGTGKGALP